MKMVSTYKYVINGCVEYLVTQVDSSNTERRSLLTYEDRYPANVG